MTASEDHVNPSGRRAADADIIRAVYAAVSAQDLETLAALTDPGVEVFVSGGGPFGGRHVGYAGIAELLSSIARHLDVSIRTEQIFSSGQCVVQCGQLVGRTRSTGECFTAAEIQVWRLSGERVRSLEFYLDDHAVRTAVDATHHPRTTDREMP